MGYPGPREEQQVPGGVEGRSSKEDLGWAGVRERFQVGGTFWVQRRLEEVGSTWQKERCKLDLSARGHFSTTPCPSVTTHFHFSCEHAVFRAGFLKRAYL